MRITLAFLCSKIKCEIADMVDYPGTRDFQSVFLFIIFLFIFFLSDPFF